MLARQDLIRAWKKKTLRFEPDISIDQINLSSVDLRLGFTFAKQKAQPSVVIRSAQDFDPGDLVENFDLKSPADVFRLRPKEFRLAQTLEKIALPAGFAAHVHGRSS